MIAVVIAEDGLHFRVMQHMPDGEIVDVTGAYVIHPMSITTPDGKEVVGFHVGQVKP